MTRLTNEDYVEIRKRVEDARKLPFITWSASKLIEGDVPALLKEIELLNEEIADRETSHIGLYNENRDLKDTVKNLRWMLERLELSVIEHCDETTAPHKIATGNGDTYLSVEELDLSVRSYNVLKRHGINDVESLVKMTEVKLLDIKNMNKHVFREILDKLSEINMSLSK